MISGLATFDTIIMMARSTSLSRGSTRRGWLAMVVAHGHAPARAFVSRP